MMIPKYFLTNIDEIKYYPLAVAQVISLAVASAVTFAIALAISYLGHLLS
jgi:hypothetical protein